MEEKIYVTWVLMDEFSGIVLAAQSMKKKMIYKLDFIQIKFFYSIVVSVVKSWK